MARRHEVFVMGEQWEKIEPLLPKRCKSAKGGGRRLKIGLVSNTFAGATERCSLARFARAVPVAERVLAAGLSSGEGEDVLPEIWYGFATFDFVHASFSPAKKVGRPSRNRQAGKLQSGW